MTQTHRVSFLVLGLAATLAEGRALADTKAEAKADPSANAARADEFFKTAKEELKHGLTADACGHFAESKRLAPGVGVTLYLADCYQRVGRTASAWSAFRDAEVMAREHKDKRSELAHHRAEVLEAKLSHLTIQVAGPAPSAPLDISLDGRPITREGWGVAVPVDPGTHVIVAQSGSWSRTYGATVDAKASNSTVTIDLPATEPKPAAPRVTPEAPVAAAPPVEAAPAAAPEPPIAEPVTTPAEGSSSTRLWMTASLGAVGVVGLGLGAVYGIMATSHHNQSDAGPCNSADFCTAAGLSLRQQALSEATISTVAFIVGAAGGAGAVMAYLLTPSGPSQTGLTVSPAVVGSGTGAVVRASF